MRIDPVILLVEEIRSLETELRAKCKANSACYCEDRMQSINLIMARIRSQYADLLDTTPISAPGAGEQIRIAAHHLPFSHARYAVHLHRIADRLGAGARLQSDLIWLRALSDTLAFDLSDEKSARTGALLAHAVKAIAQPVVVWRAVTPQRTRPPSLRGLAEGPLAF